MAMGQTFDKTFKQEAVRLVQSSGKSQRQIAEDLGVAMSTLSRWCTEMATKGERAFVGSGNQQPEAEELRRWCKVRSGMAKAALLETQSLGCKPIGVRRLAEAHAEARYRCLCRRQRYSLLASQRGRRPVKGTNGSLNHQNAS